MTRTRLGANTSDEHTAERTETAEQVLDALGERNRRRLLELLHVQRESTVTELVEASGMRQPQVSKHLKVLAEAALVRVRADGRHRHYRLDGRGLQTAHEWFGSFDDVWQARFDALDDLVANDDSAPERATPDTRSQDPT